MWALVSMRRHLDQLTNSTLPGASAVRAQGNFAENVPLSLILIALSEINGAPVSRARL